jgi:orotate phosphoribosyltransferase
VGADKLAAMTSTLDSAAARARLLELIKELAVVHGKVTLSSGKEADYYIDLRRITLHHEASGLVGRVMLDLLDDAGIEFEAAGGLTLGADPVGTAIMHTAAARDRKIDAFVVRKEQKAHGMKRQVEGPSVQGRAVVVLEDTSTTGASPLQAVEGVRNAGGEVQAVAVIVDRATGAQALIEQETGVRYLAAFSKDELGLD